MVGDQTHDPFAVGSRQSFPGIRQPFNQPVDPEVTVWIEHPRASENGREVNVILASRRPRDDLLSFLGCRAAKSSSWRGFVSCFPASGPGGNCGPHRPAPPQQRFLGVPRQTNLSAGWCVLLRQCHCGTADCTAGEPHPLRLRLFLQLIIEPGRRFLPASPGRPISARVGVETGAFSAPVFIRRPPTAFACGARHLLRLIG
jgi:hypothetical protein